MKKVLLSLSLLFVTIAGFSQAFQPVKIDSLVTVSLPPGFQKKDTLGQQLYSGNGMYGYMVAIRQANAKNNAPLQKEKDLNNVFKDYIKGIASETENSSAQNVRDTTVGTLKAKVFTLKADDGNGDVQYRNFTLIYTTDATYTFEYVYPENRQDVIGGEYKSFASSIKLSRELQRNDQYLSNDNGMSAVVKIILISGGALGLALLVVVILKRKNRLQIS